jgi:transposase
MPDEQRAAKQPAKSKKVPQTVKNDSPKKRKPPVQNPYKCTPLARDRILGALRLGASYQAAAAAGGICQTTFNLWRNEDPTFAAQVEEARGIMELRYLQRIDAAAAANWQAGAWVLERRRPEEYGRKFQPIPLVNEEKKGDEPGITFKVAIKYPDGSTTELNKGSTNQ